MRFLAFVFLAVLVATGAHSQDWTGFYGGLSASQADGQQETTGSDYPLDGSAFGLFAGYNWQRGNFVFGGELAYSDNDISLTEFPTIEYTRLVDLKGRVGYAAGRSLVYGVVGLSETEYVNGSFNSSPSGWSFGIGADVLISDRVFAGAEILRRDLDHPDSSADAEITTVSLRVGMKF